MNDEYVQLAHTQMKHKFQQIVVMVSAMEREIYYFFCCYQFRNFAAISIIIIGVFRNNNNKEEKIANVSGLESLESRVYGFNSAASGKLGVVDARQYPNAVACLGTILARVGKL